MERKPKQSTDTRLIKEVRNGLYTLWRNKIKEGIATGVGLGLIVTGLVLPNRTEGAVLIALGVGAVLGSIAFQDSNTVLLLNTRLDQLAANRKPQTVGKKGPTT